VSFNDDFLIIFYQSLSIWLLPINGLGNQFKHWTPILIRNLDKIVGISETKSHDYQGFSILSGKPCILHSGGIAGNSGFSKLEYGT
jgi:hypothetical protein